MCGDPRKHLPLQEPGWGSAAGVVTCSFPEHARQKEVYFPNGTRASFSKLPGIAGKEEEPQKMWAEIFSVWLTTVPPGPRIVLGRLQVLGKYLNQ